MLLKLIYSSMCTDFLNIASSKLGSGKMCFIKTLTSSNQQNLSPWTEIETENVPFYLLRFAPWLFRLVCKLFTIFLFDSKSKNITTYYWRTMIQISEEQWSYLLWEWLEAYWSSKRADGTKTQMNKVNWLFLIYDWKYLEIVEIGKRT